VLARLPQSDRGVASFQTPRVSSLRRPGGGEYSSGGACWLNCWDVGVCLIAIFCFLTPTSAAVGSRVSVIFSGRKTKKGVFDVLLFGGYSRGDTGTVSQSVNRHPVSPIGRPGHRHRVGVVLVKFIQSELATDKFPVHFAVTRYILGECPCVREAGNNLGNIGCALLRPRDAPLLWHVGWLLGCRGCRISILDV
jgi:hypothetical protein